jgi:DNA-binding transcriptional ArsR family regulator
MVQSPPAPGRADLDAVFHALSSAPRRELLGALSVGERTVGDLAAPFAMSVAAVSKHLKVLEGAGLVEREPAGRTTVCRLRAEPLADARAWVDRYERFWAQRIDALKQLLEDEAGEEA